MAEATTYRFISIEEDVRRTLDRKRRLRLIHKWRYGLNRAAQPANRDRGKLRTLEFFASFRHDGMTAYYADRLSRELYGPANKAA